ncbi:MAG: NADP-dependent oxidoreductase [Proteobacteria bacterium]|nr:NADP-dependent oxidoreductase [Pseudomonadota bacterium]
MNKTVNRQFLLATYPTGEFGKGTFTLHEGSIKKPRRGEFLLRNLFLSLDPAARLWTTPVDTYMDRVHIGDVMRGFTVSRVVESRHPKFKVGDLVQGLNGWQDYAISKGVNYNDKGLVDTWNLSNIVRAGMPITTALSVLGHTGLPAYVGLLNIAQIERGQTVLVSGAAGAVGSIAGQIAKLMGCRTVGIAGGPKKCRTLRESFGYDAVIDYKKENLDRALTRKCPEGIDIYFDNVGGETLDAALAHINIGARIIICGAISQYANFGQAPLAGPSNYLSLLTMRARMEGFILSDYYIKERKKMESDMLRWIKQGKITYHHEIVKGLENAPKIINKLFQGKNKGKLIIQIADDEEIANSL